MAYWEPELVASSGSSDVCSTVQFDHESFDTFQYRVLEYAYARLWPDAAEGEITAEHMRGGSNNRIIGLTWTRNESLAGMVINGERAVGPIVWEKRVMRIPRFEASHVDTHVDYDVAALLFVQRYTRISVPRVIDFDETDHNPVDSPFMVQTHVQGTPCVLDYFRLDHRQRLRLAADLGRVYSEMTRIRSTRAGSLVLPEEDKRLDAPVHVAPWDPFRLAALPEQRRRGTHQFQAGPSRMSVVDLLRTNFRNQRMTIQVNYPQDHLGRVRMDELRNMAIQLFDAGWFEGCNYHLALAHVDLKPYNIMIDATAPPGHPVLSAILDWDEAVLAPVFYACAPPLWIWCWPEGKDEDERRSHEEPMGRPAQQLKRAFEEAAGAYYMRYAYHPVYRLARRLVRFAICGLWTEGDAREAVEMLAEWRNMRNYRSSQGSRRHNSRR